MRERVLVKSGINIYIYAYIMHTFFERAARKIIYMNTFNNIDIISAYYNNYRNSKSGSHNLVLIDNVVTSFYKLFISFITIT